MHRFGLVAAVLLLASTALPQVSTSAVSQPQPMRDPQALALASQAWTKLTGGTPVQDATINATATWLVGPDREQIAAVLKIKGDSQTRMELALGTGTRVELQSVNSDGIPSCAWIDKSGSHPMPQHNALIDAAWFFPERLLWAASTQTDLSVSYIGRESLGGVPVEHLALWRTPVNGTRAAVALIQHVSRVDIYLDAASLLPSRLLFNTHPDDDASTDIPVQIAFSEYQQFGSLQVPSHVEKHMNGSLLLDLHITGLTLNTALADSDFTSN
jgi:hypothetical protein